MEDFAKVVGVIVLGLVMIVALSMFPAMLWYCVDDWLATTADAEALGKVPFLHAWSMSLLVMILFKGRNASGNKESE